MSLKVSRGLDIQKYAKKFLRLSALTSLYTSTIESHFRYCCSVWGCAGTTEINRLQKLQDRTARILVNSSFDTPSNQLIEKLGRNTINELIDLESKTIVFKSLNELVPPYLRSLFRKTSQRASYRLRNTSTDLRLPYKVQKTARNPSRLGVRNSGTASQLTASKQPQWVLLSSIFTYQMNFAILIVFVLIFFLY